jgi:hypothetical protein
MIPVFLQQYIYKHGGPADQEEGREIWLPMKEID